MTKILGGVVPVTLVRDINLTIMPREFIAITGPSGSGKSSLLYLLGLLDLPTDGDVLIDGRSTTRHDGGRTGRSTARPPWLRVPVPFPAAGIQHHRECRAADARAGPPVGPRDPGARRGIAGIARAGRSSPQDARTNCPAVSASGSRSPARSPTIRPVILADEPTGASIPFPPRRCSASSATWWRWMARPSSRSPTISISPRRCIAAFTWLTASCRTDALASADGQTTA